MINVIVTYRLVSLTKLVFVRAAASRQQRRAIRSVIRTATIMTAVTLPVITLY
jgi:hypothetical protein